MTDLLAVQGNALLHAEHVLRTLRTRHDEFAAADTEDRCLEWRRKITNAVGYQEAVVAFIKGIK